MKTLYPEQTEARIIANTFLNKKISSVYVAPCGTGKTVTASAIITDREKLGKRVFILVPQIEIMNQWIEELIEWGLNPGYCNDEGFRGRDRSVYVCMYQSLVSKLSLIDESLYPDEIIIDETQHILCSSIKEICTFFGSATRLGLTATLYHNSGQTFRPWFTESFQTITKKQAIEKGYITEPIPIVPEDYLKDANIPDLGKDYDMDVQAELLWKTRIIGDMIETYERLFCGRPVIVPCATYQQAKQITKMFCKAGWNFKHIHSERMSKTERASILSGVDRQTINGICTVGIGVEGLSIKGLWGVMWACRTKSPIRWTQFNGRGERLYPGKEFCLDVDFVGNTLIHGHPADERKWTIDGEEIKPEEDKLSWIKCWSCGTYNNPDNDLCHWCGADISEDGIKALECTCHKCEYYKKEDNCLKDAFCPFWKSFPGCPTYVRKARSLPAMVDGKLIAITTDGQRQEIKSRADQKKGEIQNEIIEKEDRKNTAEKISSFEKRKILQDGLFGSNMKRSLFEEALRG